MTPAELRYCAGICRRAAERSECVCVWDVRHIVTASSRRDAVLRRHASAALLDAASLIEAVADSPDGAERIRTVARLYECSEPEGRMLAWAWVELLLSPAT